uniref:Putative secreted salivary protein n=1 Tax=Ixodes scapularis TaxID=6945 RepID=Q4PMQ5_IXOSC|nr:putative secreted salivary protein [Ixodes scapularis]
MKATIYSHFASSLLVTFTVGDIHGSTTPCPGAPGQPCDSGPGPQGPSNPSGPHQPGTRETSPPGRK